MQTWPADLSAPPALKHAFSNVAWHAPRSAHHLDGLWQLHVYGHRGRIEADAPGGTLRAELAPGTVSVLPPGTRSRYEVGSRARFSCLHLRLGSAGGVAIAALVSDDAVASSLVAEAAASRDPTASIALAWAALWRLAAAARPALGVVATACAAVDQRLEDPPSVAELARQAGVSAAHLRRLFSAELGIGVKPWIQRRRAERARHLLAHSERSVQDIADELGLGDLQRFNKLLRRHFGRSPRRLR